MFNWRNGLAFAVFIVLANFSLAQGNSGEVAIANHLEILGTEWNSKSIDEILKTQDWAPARSDQGKKRARYDGNWYRLRIGDWISPGDWILVHPLASEFSLYRPNTAGFETSKHGYQDLNENKISYRRVAVSLSNLAKGEVLYFKIKGLAARSANDPKLVRPPAFLSTASTEAPIHSLYYAFIFIISAVSLFAFQVLREKIYLFYAIYLISNLVIFLGIQGYAYQHFPFWSPAYSLFFMGMANFFILLFIRDLFNLRSNISVILFNLLAGLSLIFALVALLGNLRFAYTLLYSVQLFTQTMVAGITAFHALYASRDRWILLSIALSFLFSTLGLLNDRVYIPFSDFIDSAYQPLSLFSAILFAYALLTRFYFPNRERMEALELARKMELQQLRLEAEKERMRIQAKLGENAAQIAHDIRSPLSALTLLMSSSIVELPEDVRLLVRSAVNRINDIANSLIARSKEEFAAGRMPDSDASLKPALLAPLIENVVSEKRIQFLEKKSLTIQADVSQGYGLFSLIGASDLQRVLSNLINNAVEALQNNSGFVTVSLVEGKDEILISVKDNGRGIPKHLLDRLGEFGLTHGKEGTPSGSGLGLYHAKKIVEAAGGQIRIDSEEGVGTTVILHLTKCSAPSWFLTELRLKKNTLVVTLDDDLSIHQLWKERLLKARGGLREKDLFTFTSINEFKAWYLRRFMTASSDVPSKQENLTYLIDYEFISHSESGIDVIEDLNLIQRAVVVTSRFEDPNIQTRAEKLGLKIIPKSHTSSVPISFE